MPIIDALPGPPADEPKPFVIDHLRADLARALERFSSDPDANALRRMFAELEKFATRREHQSFVGMATQIALRRGWMEGTRR